MEGPRRVRVLLNPRSGFGLALSRVMGAVQAHWDDEDCEVSYQFSRNAEDGAGKARRAIDEGVDTLLVAGGDGMVNTIGAALVGSEVALGVIPTGSGNGFARHFGIPLQPASSVAALRRARPLPIDVGVCNGRPFFVTCSLAWDGALVEAFNRSPVRGILPYVFAGAYELFEYRPQTFYVRVDEGPEFAVDHPLVFTAANLTQFGGGARIAPDALPGDGWLNLVYVERRDLARVIPHFPRLFTGTLEGARGVTTRRFRRLRVRRASPSAVQVDGELLGDCAEVEIRVLREALRVLVPAGPG
jgi:diacylglycerol kinase family enzyme